MEGWSVEISATTNRPYFRISGCCDSPLGQALSLDTWYHYVGVYKPGVGNTLYINGVYFGTTSGSGAITHSTNSLKIGNYNADLRLFGDIRDVRIYNRALDIFEINQLYNAK